MEFLITVGCVFLGCGLAGLIMGIHKPQTLQRLGSYLRPYHGRYLDDKKEPPSKALSQDGVPRD